MENKQRHRICSTLLSLNVSCGGGDDGEEWGGTQEYIFSHDKRLIIKRKRDSRPGL